MARATTHGQLLLQRGARLLAYGTQLSPPLPCNPPKAGPFSKSGSEGTGLLNHNPTHSPPRMQEALPSKKLSPKGAPNSLAGGREGLLSAFWADPLLSPRWQPCTFPQLRPELPCVCTDPWPGCLGRGGNPSAQTLLQPHSCLSPPASN